MKDNLPYFSHDNNARRHPKMQALIAEFGYEGYGRFWALNERIAETSGACIDISKRVNKLALANELNFNGEELDVFLDFLSSPDIDLINIENDLITTDRINELFGKVDNERERQRHKKSTGGKCQSTEVKEENTEVLPGENANLPGENDTDKTRQDKNRQDNIKQKDEKDLSKLFIKLWQSFPNEFNIFTRFKDFKAWEKFWKQCNYSPQHIETAVKNVVEAIRRGDILPRYVPKSPDDFVLNGWLLRGLDDFKPKEDEPKRNSNIPDADQTEKMIKEQKESRAEIVYENVGMLSDAFKKTAQLSAVNQGG